VEVGGKGEGIKRVIRGVKVGAEGPLSWILDTPLTTRIVETAMVMARKSDSESSV